MAAARSTEPPSPAADPSQSGLNGLLRRLFAPVEIDFLVYFRITFGIIMLWEMWRYIEAGWVQRNFVDPPLHFTFYGFSWVRPWPGDGMHWHFYAMALLAACITVGLFYRMAAALFCVGFTHLFLIDQAYYLNHFYLICLISLVMIFLPANRAFSLDAMIRKRLRKPPPVMTGKTTADTAADRWNGGAVVPVWTLWILRILVGIVYSYGAAAKLNMDWLTGNPMREMLRQADTFPLLGPYFHLERVIRFYAVSGLLLDLLIVPALCWKRTRLVALLAAAFFHLSNDLMFQIGIFPWFMLMSTLLLWPPKKLELQWLLRTILGTVYLYAVVAMMNTPWDGDGPMRLAAMFLSGVCLPLMFWKPARIPAFLFAVVWLFVSLRLFGSGDMPATLVSILPGLVMFAAIAVFPPEFLRDFKIAGEKITGEDSGPNGNQRTPADPGSQMTNLPLTLGQKMTVGLLGLFVAVQCLVPFRHCLYPGNVNWTEEGHLFAWHMKLRYKDGRAAFRATSAGGEPVLALLADGYLLAKQDKNGDLTHIIDAGGKRLYSLAMRGERIIASDANNIPAFELDADGWLIYELNGDGERIYDLDRDGDRMYNYDQEDEPVLVRDERGEPIPPRKPPYYLTRRQRTKMAERPEMVLQYAHFLADALRRQGLRNVDVRADVFCSLNGREEQRLIDPEVNLAAVKRSLGHADWILPLDPNSEPGVLYRQASTGE